MTAGKSALERYAAGEIGTREACRALDLRDGADLLIALGAAGLTLPLPPRHVIEEQAEQFARIWRDTA